MWRRGSWPPTSTVAADERPRTARGEGGAREWYGDSAYGTGDLRGAIDDAGHEAVIKPKPLQAPVEGGFTVDDFTVDEQAGTVGCPAGHTRPISRDPGGQLRCAVPRLPAA